MKEKMGYRRILEMGGDEQKKIFSRRIISCHCFLDKSELLILVIGPLPMPIS